jgi:hypothetical protein
MPQPEPRTRGAVRAPLLISTFVLLMFVLGVVGWLAENDTAWGLALAFAALAVATGAMGLVVRDLLADQDGEGQASQGPSMRWPAALLAAVVVAAVAAAIAGTHGEHAATATSALSAGSAVRTVRAYLVAADVDGDGEAGCAYLSTAEQRRVGAAAGAGSTCREALDDFGGAARRRRPAGPRTLGAFAVRVDGRSGQARVRVDGDLFVLRPATPAERAAYNASRSRWRIVSGAARTVDRSARVSTWGRKTAPKSTLIP